MTTVYDSLRQEIATAGFFTGGVEDKGSWDRICIASRRSEHGLYGISFWASRLPTGWYLGSWGGFIYRLPQGDRMAALCISWLASRPKSMSDFDGWLKEEFGLLAVSHEDFDLAAGCNE